MADYNEGLGQPSLVPLTNNLSTPADSEAVENLPAAIRQLKNILTYHLVTAHEAATGQLKSAQVVAANIPDDSVSGSNDNSTDAAAGKIKQGTVSLVDLKDLCISTAKVVDAAITAAKLADGAVETAKILDGAVTVDKLAANAVTEAKIADGSVSAAKLAAGAVSAVGITDGSLTGAKFADSTIGPDKLEGAVSAGQLLVGQTGSPKAAWRSVSGAITMDANGLTTLVASIVLGQCQIYESRSNGTDHTETTTAATVDLTTDNLAGIRGKATEVPWEKAGANAGDFTINSDGTITVGVEKSLLIRASAPGYAVGKHKIVLEHFRSTALQNRVYGSSELAPAGTQTRSILSAAIACQVGDVIRLRHHTELATANGYGKATGGAGLGGNEVYAMLEILTA